MRIQSIEISNYKAFLGTHKINVGGKNLFIYGENGSGKSSFYGYKSSDEAGKQRIYELYLANTRHVNNWDLVDCSAEHIVGARLWARPWDLLFRLAESPLLWERRIAIMASFHFHQARQFRRNPAAGEKAAERPTRADQQSGGLDAAGGGETGFRAGVGISPPTLPADAAHHVALCDRALSRRVAAGLSERADRAH
jgi:hypothetical protein